MGKYTSAKTKYDAAHPADTMHRPYRHMFKYDGESRSRRVCDAAFMESPPVQDKADPPCPRCKRLIGFSF